VGRIKSITRDPRYPELVRRYRGDWVSGSLDLFGKEPTPQQVRILLAIQLVGEKVSVSSGHGTGKSDMTSIIILLYMLTHPGARVIVVANKIAQVQQVVWKYLKINFRELCRRHPWIEQYFVLTETTFFEVSSKGVWFVSPKGCRIGNEESLAGEHAEHMLYIVDERGFRKHEVLLYPGMAAAQLAEVDFEVLPDHLLHLGDLVRHHDDPGAGMGQHIQQDDDRRHIRFAGAVARTDRHFLPH
jgi:hypothetical protein